MATLLRVFWWIALLQGGAAILPQYNLYLTMKMSPAACYHANVGFYSADLRKYSPVYAGDCYGATWSHIIPRDTLHYSWSKVVQALALRPLTAASLLNPLLTNMRMHYAGYRFTDGGTTDHTVENMSPDLIANTYTVATTGERPRAWKSISCLIQTPRMNLFAAPMYRVNDYDNQFDLGCKGIISTGAFTMLSDINTLFTNFRKADIAEITERDISTVLHAFSDLLLWGKTPQVSRLHINDWYRVSDQLPPVYTTYPALELELGGGGGGGREAGEAEGEDPPLTFDTFYDVGFGYMYGTPTDPVLTVDQSENIVPFQTFDCKSSNLHVSVRSSAGKAGRCIMATGSADLNYPEALGAKDLFWSYTSVLANGEPVAFESYQSCARSACDVMVTRRFDTQKFELSLQAFGEWQGEQQQEQQQQKREALQGRQELTGYCVWSGLNVTAFRLPEKDGCCGVVIQDVFNHSMTNTQEGNSWAYLANVSTMACHSGDTADNCWDSACRVAFHQHRSPVTTKLYWNGLHAEA